MFPGYRSHLLRVALNRGVREIPLECLESSKLLIEFIAHCCGTGILHGPIWSQESRGLHHEPAGVPEAFPFFRVRLA